MAVLMDLTRTDVTVLPGILNALVKNVLKLISYVMEYETVRTAWMNDTVVSMMMYNILR